MGEAPEKRVGWLELRSFSWLLCRLAASPFYCRVFFTTLSLALQLLLTLCLLETPLVWLTGPCFTVFDTCCQLFVFFFMRMSQMRRLNMFRNNCVFIIFAVFGLLFPRKLLLF